jgi:hypothetical protein
VAESSREDSGVREFHTPYRFVRFPLSDVMLRKTEAPPLANSDNILRGKVVILGGSFGDEHPTSFGTKLGIEVVGSAVEDELAGSSPTRLRTALTYATKVMIAICLAVFYTYLRPRYAFGATALLGAATVALSFAAFYYNAYRIDFVPFLIGMWLEQLDHLLELPHHRTRPRVAKAGVAAPQ